MKFNCDSTILTEIQQAIDDNVIKLEKNTTTHLHRLLANFTTSLQFTLIKCFQFMNTKPIGYGRNTQNRKFYRRLRASYVTTFNSICKYRFWKSTTIGRLRTRTHCATR